MVSDLSYILLLQTLIMDSLEYKEFYNRLKNNDPYYKLIDIINHIVQNSSHENNKTNNYILKHLEPISLKEINAFIHEDDTINFNELEQIKHNIWKIYLENINTEIAITLESIVSSNLLFDLDPLFKNNLSILKNEKLLLVSPILFSDEIWRKIILHELSILNDERLIEITLLKFKGSLTELNYKIGGEKIPNISLSDSYGKMTETITVESFSIYNFWDSAQQKLEFLESISAKDIIRIANKKMLESFKKEDSIKIQLKKEESKSKISLQNPKDIKKITKGLEYLFKKSNPKTEISLIKEVANLSAQKIFHNSNISDESSSLNLNDLLLKKDILIQYFLFLEKEEYFDKTIKVSIPNIIFNNWPLKNGRGWALSNLYLLTSKYKKLTTLPFNKLTSEIALRNEMIN
jgi:hypothetical protein